MPARILGDFSTQPNCCLPPEYFEQRDCWVDCRGPDMLHIHPQVNVGWNVTLITQTHNITPGMFNEVTNRPITIEKDVYIGSFAILYNCHVGEGAVIAVGTVLRSVKVAPWTMVEGNPARAIAWWNGHEWARLPRERILEHN